MKTVQVIITPAAGKRLIGKAIASRRDISDVLKSGTLVIIAGTTNGYIAEEILASINQAERFNRKRFFRGITLPPSLPTTEFGRLPDESDFPGDAVIVDGQWQRGKTVFDVVDELSSKDIIIKGANAVNLSSKRAGIYIGHPHAGTIGVSLKAVFGRRVKLLLPVGLEKRINTDLDELALLLNSSESEGPRLMPVLGEVFTELDALSLLTGVKAQLVAGGGVGGAEGSVWLALSGTEEQIEKSRVLFDNIKKEPLFSLN